MIEKLAKYTLLFVSGATAVIAVANALSGNQGSLAQLIYLILLALLTEIGIYYFANKHLVVDAETLRLGLPWWGKAWLILNPISWFLIILWNFGVIPSPLPRIVFAPVSISTSLTATSTSTITTTPTATRTATYTATHTATATAIITLTPSSTPTSTPSQTIQPHQTAINKNDGAAYVVVQDGNFLIGSNSNFPNESPQHTVFVNKIWIRQTEVTNGQYAKCVDAKACTPPNGASWKEKDFANLPVVNLDWFQASDYANWVGGRLPTEAEWEKSCRGIDGRLYPWGDSLPTKDFLAFNKIAPSPVAVAAYRAGVSPYGAYDMAGNVEEWVSDWYSETYYRNSPTNNPAGPANGETKIVRGGSYEFDATGVRCAYRGSNSPTTRHKGIGFRVVLTLQPTP